MPEQKVNTRSLILDALMAILEQGEFSHLVIGQLLAKYQYLPDEDRSFISRMVLGCVERKITLDYMLDEISTTPTKKMKPVIRNILRMGAYELHYMTGAKSYAVCNEAVKLATKRGFGGLKGFVNGVLRNFDRKHQTITFPSLEIEYSTPEWLVNMWVEDYGLETTKEILQSQYEERPLWIRVNTNRISLEEFEKQMCAKGVKLRQDTEILQAYEMTHYTYLESYELWQQGCLMVQDYSSMQVVHQAGISKHSKVLDLCAAPGGKTTHAAICLQGTGHVTARDVSEKKVALIEENVQRLRLENVTVMVADATVYMPEDKEAYDVVIADLPCSGLGVLGKKPDIKYHASQDACKELSILQRRILENAVQYVKPGGILMYSTCTIHRQENEENASYIEKKLGLKKTYEKQLLPGGEKHQDGFYLARFEKPGKTARIQ